MGGIRIGSVTLAVVGVVLASALTPMVAAQPSVDVSINGTGITDGERVTVTDDPALSIDVSAETTISSVEIRVGETTRRSYQPDSESFSERVTLDLDEGEHEVSVVAEATDVRRLTATIKKDSNAPLVTYHSPFQSNGYPADGRVTIGRANTTLVADLHDISAIDQVRIERNYEWTFASSSKRSRETYRLQNPGKNVSQPILFGLGDNELKVEVIDEHGQRRTHPMTVAVVDDQRPAIDLERFERTDSGELLIEGTVSDNVKVNSLQYRVSSTGDSQYILNPTTKEPTRERLEVDFSVTASVNEDTESVLLEATDIAGNTRRWQVPIDYRGHLDPSISIDDEATRVEGESITVEGLVADGRVTRVVVDAVAPDGSVVDSATVYEGAATDRVVVSERLDAASDETTVAIRAVDSAGRQHRAELVLQTPTTPAATDQPSPTVTATATATDTAVSGGGAADAGGSGSDTSGRTLPLLPPVLAFGLIGTLVGVVVVVVGIRRIDWSGLSLPTSSSHDEVTRRPSSTDPDVGDDPYGTGDDEIEAPNDEVGTPSGDDPVKTDDSATADAGAEPDAAAEADAGTEADAAAEADPGTEADAAAEADPGTEADTGTETDAAAETDPAAEADTGAEADAAQSSGGEVRRYVEQHSVGELGTDDVASFVEELDAADVPTLVECLDADDAETVAMATRILGETAARRPSLVADSTAKNRLRDLRLASEPIVIQEANRAVRQFEEADIY